MRDEDTDAEFFPGRLCFPMSVNWELLGCICAQ